PSMTACFEVTRPMTVRKPTLLPEPDSPTTPSVSPGAREQELPSTALTRPSSVGKCTLRFLTSRRGLATPYLLTDRLRTHPIRVPGVTREEIALDVTAREIHGKLNAPCGVADKMDCPGGIPVVGGR